MEIRIRNYQSTDYSDLISLLNKVYGSEIEQTVLEDNYLTSNRSIIVAVNDEDFLLGCAFTEIQEDFVRFSRVLYVTYVAVNEDYRKLGIGRKIFDYIEDLCNKTECSSIEFTSADFRTGAHAFYEKMGYSKKKTTHFVKEI